MGLGEEGAREQERGGGVGQAGGRCSGAPGEGVGGGNATKGRRRPTQETRSECKGCGAGLLSNLKIKRWD